jgi:hypothetical protein
MMPVLRSLVLHFQACRLGGHIVDIIFDTSPWSTGPRVGQAVSPGWADLLLHFFIFFLFFFVGRWRFKVQEDLLTAA